MAVENESLQTQLGVLVFAEGVQMIQPLPVNNGLNRRIHQYLRGKRNMRENIRMKRGFSIVVSSPRKEWLDQAYPTGNQVKAVIKPCQPVKV